MRAGGWWGVAGELRVAIATATTTTTAKVCNQLKHDNNTGTDSRSGDLLHQ